MSAAKVVSNLAFAGNLATKRANAKLFQAERLAKEKTARDFKMAMAPLADAVRMEQNRVTEQRNAAYLRQLEEVAQGREQKRRNILAAAERQRLIKAENEKRLAAHRARMEIKRNQIEAVKSNSRREYLRALNEDVMAWNVSPSELDFARYRIEDADRFRLFDH